jgi:hypothetical protein
MPPSKSIRPVEGFNRVAGTLNPPTTSRANPAATILQDKAGNDWYYWPTTAGVLRFTDAVTAETPGFDWETGGTAV